MCWILWNKFLLFELGKHATVHIPRLPALRPPWSLFWRGCNLTLMCCEWETWARIKTAAAGLPPLLNVHIGIRRALDGTCETWPWNIIHTNNTVREPTNTRTQRLCQNEKRKKTWYESFPTLTGSLIWINCRDTNNFSVFAVTRSASRSNQTNSKSCAEAFKL